MTYDPNNRPPGLDTDRPGNWHGAILLAVIVAALIVVSIVVWANIGGRLTATNQPAQTAGQGGQLPSTDRAVAAKHARNGRTEHGVYRQMRKVPMAYNDRLNRSAQRPPDVDPIPSMPPGSNPPRYRDIDRTGNWSTGSPLSPHCWSP
jgi:hypothetical protein